MHSSWGDCGGALGRPSARNRGGYEAMTQERFVDCRDQVGSQARFCHVAISTFREARADKLGFFMNSEENKPGGRSRFVEFVGGFDPSKHWHHDVQHNYIRLESFRFADQFPAVLRSSNDLKVRTEKRRHPLQNGAIVIGEENSRSAQGNCLPGSKLDDQTGTFTCLGASRDSKVKLSSFACQLEELTVLSDR